MSLFELQQYLKILTCEPFYHNMTWRALCWVPFQSLDPMGLNAAKCEPGNPWQAFRCTQPFLNACY